MGNIGSELARATHWEAKGDPEQRNRSLERALELLDHTLDDARWGRGIREIARMREVVAAWFSGNSPYIVPKGWLENYCTQYVLCSAR